MSKDTTGIKPTSVEPTSMAGPVHAGVEQGTVADVRRMPLHDPALLWEVPGTFSELAKEIVVKLSKIAENQGAELQLAVGEIEAKGPTLQKRFGEMAPDTSVIPALWKRYKDALTGEAKATKQVAYYGDVAQVALHDILQIVGLVDETVRPTSTRNAQVADEFEAVLKISDQRGAIIRDARARTKSEKTTTNEAVTAAVAAAEKKPA